MDGGRRADGAVRAARIGGRMCAFVLAFSACGGPPPPPEPAKADAASRRSLGAAEITGFTGAYGNHAWLGLRYARAPRGELRFRGPQLLAPPAGAQQALAFGSPCPQYAHPFGVDAAKQGTPVGDEDCLFLNVYAPVLSAEQAATTRLPVMVWFHGGSNVIGHAGGYDGGNLARRERVIVVTANYRLGPLGWFRHASLRAGASPEEASGNYGTLDQIAVLRWVRSHIAAFGGDAGNVTIFGESAGARDVLALLIAPPARGLFHRAIAQSGSMRPQDARVAEVFASEGGHASSANEVIARLLVADGKAKDAAAARAALQKMQPGQIATYVRGKAPTQLLAVYGKTDDERLSALPNVFSDGVVISEGDPLALLARPDAHASVPVMLGTNRDENKTFMMTDPKHVRRFTPLYTRMRDPDHYDALAAALSLSWKVSGADAPASALATSGSDVYVYRFDWDEEPSLLGADYGVLLGAGHGLEIPFVFGHFVFGPRSGFLFPEETKATRQQLAQAMMGYWAEFARRGRPGSGRGGALPRWEAFGAGEGAQHFMVFDTVQGGGVRLAQGSVDMSAVIASVLSDARLPDARARCSVLREVMRSSAYDRAAREKVDATCKQLKLANAD